MAYTRINWRDYPDTSTPITANNLNKMDEQLYELAKVQVLNGIFDAGDIYENTKTTKTLTFPKAFKFAPVVFVSMYSDSEGYQDIPMIAAAVNSTTPTEVTFNVYAGAFPSGIPVRHPTLSWIAIGEAV